MTGPAFTTDPGNITAGSKAIKELGEAAKHLADAFRAAMADTSWTGDDSFGRDLRPKFVKNRDSIQATIDAISDGISSIGDGTMANLGTMQSTQSSVIQSIEQQSAATGGHP
ncbi:hypothetical protein [Streptomyces sp. NPDC001843]|uniref:hypothetical protein n=1 Tax=Streptomyces sp. NPDC001843 TaxID=3364617 RepID=UPI0036AEBC7F